MHYEIIAGQIYYNIKQLTAKPHDLLLLHRGKKKNPIPSQPYLAHSYLCVPVTSVCAEHVFSAAGLTVIRLRSQLSSKHVNILVFPT